MQPWALPSWEEAARPSVVQLPDDRGLIYRYHLNGDPAGVRLMRRGEGPGGEPRDPALTLSLLGPGDDALGPLGNHFVMASGQDVADAAFALGVMLDESIRALLSEDRAEGALAGLPPAMADDPGDALERLSYALLVNPVPALVPLAAQIETAALIERPILIGGMPPLSFVFARHRFAWEGAPIDAVEIAFHYVGHFPGLGDYRCDAGRFITGGYHVSESLWYNKLIARLQGAAACLAEATRRGDLDALMKE